MNTGDPDIRHKYAVWLRDTGWGRPVEQVRTELFDSARAPYPTQSAAVTWIRSEIIAPPSPFRIDRERAARVPGARADHRWRRLRGLAAHRPAAAGWRGVGDIAEKDVAAPHPAPPQK